jgi:predicted NAD/FAD-dependent oxidoreductase
LPHGVYLCGDYCQTASINGALASGRKTAEAILAAIQR